MSADGRYLAFTSTATDLIAGHANGTTADVFVKDLDTGAVTLASESTAGTGSPFGASMTNAARRTIAY